MSYRKVKKETYFNANNRNSHSNEENNDRNKIHPVLVQKVKKE